ncbi:hypothetical protein [Virgisporangium aurantiacum]|nr:hypothetical protein [Virgisporangium aurantiacum]
MASPAGPDPSSGGSVSVSVDAGHYPAGRAVIVVSVRNGGPVPVFTDDQKSDCTVALLERRIGQGWVGLRACGAERAPAVVHLEPGAVHVARIDLGSENFRPQPVTPGTYRGVVGYRPAAEPSGEEPQLAVSATFVVT